ncbi:DNA-(apurinic or apyrimidinic site) lyase [Chamberlinius hualienensis]
MPPKKGASKVSAKRKKDDSEDDFSDAETSSKAPAKAAKKQRLNSIESVLTDNEFNGNGKSAKGKDCTLKISSWNVNGLRAVLSKKGFAFLKYENPDIFCVQETKCSEDKIPHDAKIEGYHCYWSCCDSSGYSGVGLYTKIKPINVTYGIGISKHDEEGRVITAEYDDFYLVTTYVPNAGRKLVRLDYRMGWDKDFQKYLTDLDAKKPIILCGDLNVAHEEIDLTNPKSNKRNAGFTKEERDGFTQLLEQGFVDSFRHLNPKKTGAYTFWTYLGNCRSKNVGW